MGSYTWSDIVNNVAEIGDLKEISDMFNEDEFMPIHGWEFSPWNKEDGKAGRKKSLYVDKAIKGTKSVYLLNTSQYANGGDYNFAVFSEDRSAVEEFLKDFGLDGLHNIEDIDSVCQTL